MHWTHALRPRLLLALALLVALATVEADAQTACQNRDGTERDCTVSESFNHCIDASVDAYYQCLGRAGEDWEPGSIGYTIESTVCQMWLAADQFACGLAAGKKTVLS